MKKERVLIVFVCVMAVANFASADTIRGINIDFVTIGNAGNTADTTGRGAVGYNYRIGKYEVTNAQWNIFTAAAGTPTGNPDTSYDQSASTTGTQPTNFVSWYETIQFCNYLTSGDKSKGAYQFSGNNTNPGDFLGVNRTAAVATYGIVYVLPTEDEWYKAAYYKPDAGGYSIFANGTDTAPVAGLNSNYDNAVGTFWNAGTGTMEQNGTFDMMGNVWEWNETLKQDIYRHLSGGAYPNNSDTFDSSFTGGGLGDPPSPLSELGVIGFRIAEIPEPATLLLLGLGTLSLIRRKNNK